ncbi:MAG: hypothetical protein ACREM8_12215, partial [Vulcanimicrobiaceae bacterium]
MFHDTAAVDDEHRRWAECRRGVSATEVGTVLGSVSPAIGIACALREVRLTTQPRAKKGFTSSVT